MVPSAGISLLKSEYPLNSNHVTSWKSEMLKPYDGEEIDSEVLDSDWVDDFIDNIRVI